MNALPVLQPVRAPPRPARIRLPRRARPAGRRTSSTAPRTRSTSSSPRRGAPYPNPAGGDAPVNAFNPLWRLFDRSRDRRTATPGPHDARGDRRPLAGRLGGLVRAGQSTPRGDRRGARQAERGRGRLPRAAGRKPVVPALAVQSEYGFNVQPYWMQHGSSIQPQPGPAAPRARTRAARRATGFDAWRAAGVDSMLVVPRASTHLEYTDIAYVLPASRYGQALTSVYVQSVAGPLPEAPRARGCWQRACATSSRWTWAAGTRSSSTARSCSASTSAPATHSADG